MDGSVILENSLVANREWEFPANVSVHTGRCLEIEFLLGGLAGPRFSDALECSRRSIATHGVTDRETGNPLGDVDMEKILVLLSLRNSDRIFRQLYLWLSAESVLQFACEKYSFRGFVISRQQIAELRIVRCIVGKAVARSPAAVGQSARSAQRQ